MTVGDKLNSIDSLIHVYTYSALALVVIFVVALIVAIVFTVKDKRKGIPIIVMVISGIIFAAVMGLGLHQKSIHQDYDAQMNYYYARTGVTPESSRELNLNQFKHRIIEMHQIDQKIASRMQH